MRKCSSWTDAFNKYMEKSGSPELFRKWTGIFTVAAALERKVFVQTSKGVLHPNLYVILVGPPAAGKTIASAFASDIMRETLAGSSSDEHKIAPTNVSRASMIDALDDAKRRFVTPKMDAVIEFNSMAIFSNELGTLIPAYENDFIQVLTDLYDGKRFHERKRTRSTDLLIDNPQINLLAATTPSYLQDLLPEGAWDQGFISRTTLIYSGRSDPVDLFDDVENDSQLYRNLVQDLDIIGQMYGRMYFDNDAVEAFRAWIKSGEAPAPTHPKLSSYSSRRAAHLLKLCMISSAATRDDLKVGLENFVEALDWMVQAEHTMGDIFKAMVTGGATRIIDETWHHAYEWWLKKNKQPIPEMHIYEFVTQRAPAGDVVRIIDLMKKNGILTEQLTPGGTAFVPRARRQL